MFARLRLHTLLFLGLMLISTVPVVMLGFWVQQTALDREMAEVRDRHLLLAKNLTGSLARYTTDVENTFRFATQNLAAGVRPEGISNLLHSLEIQHVCLFDAQGLIRMRFPGTSHLEGTTILPGVLGHLKPYLLSAAEQPGEVVFSNVMDNAKGDPAIYLVQALEDGLFALGELRPRYVKQVQRQITFGQRGHAAIVDKAGTIIAHPSPAWQQERKNISAVDPVRLMMEGHTGVTTFYSPGVKAWMVAGYTFVPRVGWGVMIPQPIEELKARAGEVRRMAVYISLLGLLIAIVISWWLARFLSGPVRAVAHAAREITAGRMAAPASEISGLMPLELRELTHSFNRMVEVNASKTAELADTAARLSAAQRIARMGNWVWNLERGTLWWSDEVYEIWQVDKSVFQPDLKTYERHMHPEDLEEVRHKFNTVIKEGGTLELEHRLLLPGGKQLLLHLLGVAESDASGKTVSIQGTLHDITERRRAEELEASEERFRNLVGNAADAFFLHDENIRLIEVNEQACQTLGYSREELLALPLEALLLLEEEPPPLQGLGELRPGDALVLYGQLIQKDGTPIPVEIKTGVVESSGERLFISVARDITERQRMESQLVQSQKMEAIGRLAGGIAHDFNNILVPILGYTELTMETQAYGSENHHNLEVVYNAALRAKEIVSQILQFSRKSDRKPTVIDFTACVGETLALLKSTLPKNIELSDTLSAEPVYIFADVAQIHRVVLNLCVNAGQAMPDGGRLAVKLEQVHLEGLECFDGGRMDGACAWLCISDTGKGMDSGTLTRIFEPFFTTKPVGQGTGLGLSSVLGIVDQHQGGLRVASTPGRGTTFDLYFHTVPAPSNGGDISEKEASRPEDISILFVDDEPKIAEVMKRILEKAGYGVTSLSDSQSALRRFRDSPEAFDLVITDQMMPGITGERLVERFREIRPNIPIILSTGYSDVLTPERLHALRVNHFFHKPIKSAELLQLVRKTLHQDGGDTRGGKRS